MVGAGKQLLFMAVTPVCLLLAHVLELPSHYVAESCIVPVSCITTAKLPPPGSSVSATNRSGVGRACTHEGLYLSLSLKLASFLYFPDMTLELAVYRWS